jgi:hypothetical protein
MSERKAEYLSAKIMRYYHSENGAWTYAHWCPACKCLHMFWVDQPTHKGARWSYNNKHESPTFAPSMNISWGSPSDEDGIHGRCHYTLNNGVLSYCDDSMHEMANQHMPLPDIPLQQWYYVGVIPPNAERN